MLKIPRYCLIAASLSLASCSPEATDDGGEYDERAIAHLDELAEAIGALESSSFTLYTSVSGNSREHDVYLRGPDKIYFHSYWLDDGAETGYWYDGTDISYYSYGSDTYGTVAAPGNILTAIDFMSENYGIDFPAGDFFYPTFTDDIIDNYSNVWFVGEETIDDIETVLIEAGNADENLRIWIDSATHFPYRMSITASGDEGDFYEAVFANWKADPFLPDRMFAFSPPSNAERVDFKKK